MDEHVAHVAGGLAVNAHGYLRFTRDVDLVVQLAPENIVAAFSAFESIGYRPVVPVSAAQFADPATRDGWIRDKGMTVLNFWCDSHRETPIDLFVSEPFNFDEEYRRALVKPLGGVAVRFVSIPSLIRMKELAGGRRIRSTSTTCASSPMPRSDDRSIDWSLTTWEGAEREQLRRWAELTLEEIVRAQEEMQDLAERLTKAG
ncbi:MAG TPA: hypothetical protein VE085_11200 [Burkholderiales bacterium]|nr:hypothetical protein [Burkholderiales bacterium]